MSREKLLPAPDWRRADWDSMKAELHGAWKREVLSTNGDMAWRMMKAKVEDLIRRFVPERRRRYQNRPIWMTQEIRHQEEEPPLEERQAQGRQGRVQ